MTHLLPTQSLLELPKGTFRLGSTGISSIRPKSTEEGQSLKEFLGMEGSSISVVFEDL